jgi:hypothetical protein
MLPSGSPSRSLRSHVHDGEDGDAHDRVRGDGERVVLGGVDAAEAAENVVVQVRVRVEAPGEEAVEGRGRAERVWARAKEWGGVSARND